CLVQGLMLLVAFSTNPGSIIPGFNPAAYGEVVLMGKTQFLITGTIFLTAGSMIMVWLGEQITQKGIGNGISLLI
ncbi:MAG: preprotein translocase subunit SecY, partial [Opitutales bacterium]